MSVEDFGKIIEPWEPFWKEHWKETYDFIKQIKEKCK